MKRIKSKNEFPTILIKEWKKKKNCSNQKKKTICAQIFRDNPLFLNEDKGLFKNVPWYSSNWWYRKTFKLFKKIVNGIINQMSNPLFRGNPQNNYSNYTKRQKISMILDRISRGVPSIYKISALTGIPESTLRNWKRCLIKNPEWRPWQTCHGQGHRIFTNTEEKAIKDYIIDCFLKPGYVFTNDDFIEIVMNAYLTKYQDEINIDEKKQFMASSHFITDFKKRNHISSRSLHAKRRPIVSQDSINTFVERIRQLLSTVDHGRIINCDETSWRAFPNGILTWAETGSDSININVMSNEKESLTVIASIKADGTKIPLYFIAKGKTQACEASQIGDVSPHMPAHSENGWTTAETFSGYLIFLRQHFNDDDEIHLILDSYKAHICETVRNLANALKIKL